MNAQSRINVIGRANGNRCENELPWIRERKIERITIVGNEVFSPIVSGFLLGFGRSSTKARDFLQVSRRTSFNETPDTTHSNQTNPPLLTKFIVICHTARLAKMVTAYVCLFFCVCLQMKSDFFMTYILFDYLLPFSTKFSKLILTPP